MDVSCHIPYKSDVQGLFPADESGRSHVAEVLPSPLVLEEKLALIPLLPKVNLICGSCFRVWYQLQPVGQEQFMIKIPGHSFFSEANQRIIF